MGNSKKIMVIGATGHGVTTLVNAIKKIEGHDVILLDLETPTQSKPLSEFVINQQLTESTYKIEQVHLPMPDVLLKSKHLCPKEYGMKLQK